MCGGKAFVSPKYEDNRVAFKYLLSVAVYSVDCIELSAFILMTDLN